MSSCAPPSSVLDDTGSGQDVIDKLARHKVNTRYIQRMPDGMGTWLAVFNNDGDVCAAISKRPDTKPLTALLKEKGDEIFSSLRRFIISSLIWRRRPSSRFCTSPKSTAKRSTPRSPT